MAIPFVYRGQTYGSIPMLPIQSGSSVIVLSANLGVLSAARRWVRHIGVVDGLYRPGSPEHEWWSHRHSTDYHVPPTIAHDTLVSVVFSTGVRCMYLYTDLLHVLWLSTDVHPAALPAFSLFFI